MKPLSERSTIRPSCKVSFNTCVDCGALFTARRSQRKRCPTCNDQTIKTRKAKGLKKLIRKCLNPSCGVEFETYNIKQFACCVKCSNIVSGMRRKYERKLRAFLSICPNCGSDAFEHNTCNNCFDKIGKNKGKKRRYALKEAGMCQECGKNKANSGGYRCDACLELMRKRTGSGICSINGCNNSTDYHKTICNKCLELREAEKQSCKVYFFKCYSCGELFTSKVSSSMYCSYDCKRERRMVKKIRRKCTVCGVMYKLKQGDNFDNTCSKECRRVVIRRWKRKSKYRRKQRIRSEFIEHVSIRVLFKRDGGRCQICGKKLNMKNKVPHKLAPTRDHIIPASKGGETSYKNMQLACFSCNSYKSDRVIGGGDQLLLFGDPTFKCEEAYG